jgi:hypothetical protein
MKTTFTTDAPTCSSAETKPEFIRLPRAGSRCPYTGLSRSKLNELVLPCAVNGFKPPVRSKVLRLRGRVKGVRLIVFDSLIAFLHDLPDDGSGSPGAPENPGEEKMRVAIQQSLS